MTIARSCGVVSVARVGREGNRAGPILAGLGCGAALPGGDQHGERSDRLFVLRAAHRRGDGALHAHRRWLPDVSWWWWHGGERPGAPGSLTLVKVRVQGAALTAVRSRFPVASLVTAHAAHSRPVSAAPPCPRQTPAIPGERARRCRCAPHGPGTGWATGASSTAAASLHLQYRRAASIVDIPPGDISLGAHRKARIGRCQHARRGRGYRSQHEPATVPGVRGRIGMRATRPWTTRR